MTNEELEEQLDSLESMIMLAAIVALGPPKVMGPTFHDQLRKHLEARTLLQKIVDEYAALKRGES